VPIALSHTVRTAGDAGDTSVRRPFAAVADVGGGGGGGLGAGDSALASLVAHGGRPASSFLADLGGLVSAAAAAGDARGSNKTSAPVPSVPSVPSVLAGWLPEVMRRAESGVEHARAASFDGDAVASGSGAMPDDSVGGAFFFPLPVF
jgi:hypothetical protein